MTFERALAHIHRYRPGDTGIAPWLLRIAQGANIDAARRSHEIGEVTGGSEDATKGLLTRALAALSETLCHDR